TLTASADGLPQGDRAARFHEGHLLDPVIPVLGAHPMGFHADALDATVRPAPPSHFLEGFMDVGLFIIERLGIAALRGHLQTLRDPVYSNHSFGAHKVCGAHGHQANTAAAPNRHNIPLFNSGEISPHVSGRYRIGNKDCLLIRDAVGYLECVGIAEGYTDVLGMTPRIAPEGVAVPDDAGAAVTIRKLGKPRLGIGVVTARECLPSTVFALAASKDRHDNYTIALSQAGNAAPCLDDFTQELVSQYVARLHGRNIAADQVQIRTAHGRHADTDNN